VAGIRADLARVLAPVLAPGGSYALLGYPRARNVGDYLIWLGTLELLRQHGHSPVYTCDRTTYSATELAIRLGPGGTVLLAGGGSLGDLWPPEQRFREQVVKDFPGVRIVQLPQSMHFGTAANLERAVAVFTRHPDLTLFLRDEASLEAARASFGERTALCPDMAFGLPPIPLADRAASGVLWLGRGDHECRHPPTRPLPPNFRRWDWAARAGPPLGWPLLRRVSRALTAAPLGVADRAGAALWGLACDRLPAAHLARGVAALNAAEVVVTDRLHGHILSLLLGRPQVVLDNRDGKVGAFAARWTASSPIVEIASCAADAVERATALLNGSSRRASAQVGQVGVVVEADQLEGGRRLAVGVGREPPLGQ
jgi:pyruvyl transferase EpsO